MPSFIREEEYNGLAAPYPSETKSTCQPDLGMRVITHDEMRALLAPLQSCLQRVESTVHEISQTLPPMELLENGTHASRDASRNLSRSADSQEGSSVVLSPENQSSFALSPAKTASEQPCTLPEQEQAFDRETSPTSDKSNQENCANSDEQEDSSARPSAPRRANSVTDTDNHYFAPDQQGLAHGESSVLEHLEINKALKAGGLSDGINAVDRLALKLEKSARWWESLEEPKRDTCMYKLATSRFFEGFAMTVIIANSALVAYTLDWQIQNIGKVEPKSLEILEKACFVWFVIELIIRGTAHRWHFFINNDMQWNIFDLVLVAISLVSVALDLVSSSVNDSSNVGFMRMVRLMKLAKIFRSLRSFRFVKALELLLESFQRSFVSLFWGLVMLAFVLYLFSLIFIQALTDQFAAEGAAFDVEQNEYALQKMGSLGATFLSLYMAVTGGDDWGNLYDVIVPTGWVYGLGLVFFTFFFLFALFNILTGSLVEKAMAASKPDRTDMIMRQRMHAAEEKDQFMELCKAMDSNGDGVISWQEFQKWMCNPVMLTYMASIGIQIYDVELFFQTVGAREGRAGNNVKPGQVTIPHFVEGCMHMKGTATALDMQRQLFELHVLHHDLAHFEHSFNSRVHNLENLMNVNWKILKNFEKRLSTTNRRDPSLNIGVSL